MEEQKSFQMEQKHWIGVAILILVIIGISIHFANRVPRASIENAVNAAVATDLTYPDNSTFAPDSDITITKASQGTYQVTGYVDGSNAFGVKMRDNYSAVAIKMSGGSWNVNWSLTNTVTGQQDNGDNVESGN